MNYSLVLLASTCLAGGWGDSRIVSAASPATSGPVIVSSDCGRGCDDCCEHHGKWLSGLWCRLGMKFHHSCSGCGDCQPCASPCECDCAHSRGHWLRNLFRRWRCQGCCTECPCTAAPALLPPPPPPPVKQPEPRPMPPVKPVAATSSSSPMEIRKEYLSKVGHASDYSWLTGQLYVIHVHGDELIYVVRYAPVDAEDRYGGSVVLAPVVNMDSYQEGDLVTVHGEVLNEGRASRYLGGPLYRATSVMLLERMPGGK